MSDNKSRIMTQKQRQISNAFEVKRNVKIIPAKKDIIENQNHKLHVAAYCRVSTFDDS